MYYIHVDLGCWNLCGSLGTSISKHLHLKAFHCEPQKDPVLRTSHSSIALLVTTDLLGILHEQSWSNDNKTIGDEGITVDFSIIKVYTSN